MSVYDTLDHNIGGVSQQQGNNTSLTFNSQWGTINVNTLPLISGQTPTPPEPQKDFTQQVTQPNFASSTPNQVEAPANNTVGQYSVDETLQIIEKLAQLRDSNALSDDEFNIKKSELLKGFNHYPPIA
ncbi:SHOCT domain-containing protein [Pseudoalteromonas sp. B28]